MNFTKKKAILAIFISLVVCISFFSVLVQAPAITWSDNTITSSLPYAIDTAIGDIDQDGYDDIVAIGRHDTNGYIAWYKNNTLYSSWTEYVIYNIGGNRIVLVDDFNNDGWPDVAVSNYINDRIDIFENDGTPDVGTWTRHVVTTTFIDPGYIMWIEDFDKDGDVDIFGTSPYQSRVIWFRNNGGFSFTSFIVADLSGARGCAKGDFDNDGDTDVTGAIGGSPYTIYWYENDINNGTTEYWSSTTIGGGTVNEPTGQFGMDVDMDGDDDLVVKSLSNSALYWYENDNDGTTWTAHQITSSYLGTTYTIYGGDLDNDGDNDIGCSNFSGNNIFWLENTAGDGTTWTADNIKTGIGDTRDVLFADYLDNGILDVFGCALTDNAVWWFESNLTVASSTNTSTNFTSINGGGNNSYDGDDTKYFRWERTDDTRYYNLQVANDSGFTDIYYNVADINETNYGVNYYEFTNASGNFVHFNLSSSVGWGWKYYRVRAFTYD